MARVEAKELARCFDAHAAALVLYARQWLPAPAAEDLVQEVFVRLAALPAAPQNLRAWLLTCVRHGALDALKIARHRAARDQQAGTAHARLLEARGASAMDALEVQEALASLPADEREIVTLKLWTGATFQEIAAITAMPLATVFSRYRSALESLRTRWESPCRKT